MKRSLHTNYQTSFRIKKVSDTTFNEIILLIYSWIKQREKDNRLRTGSRFFVSGGNWKTCFSSGADISTWRAEDEHNEPIWTLEYTHADRGEGRRRYWHTHVGLRQTKDDIIVSTRVAYSWNNEDLGFERTEPAPSVPYFVRLLLKKFTVYCGQKVFRLIEKPIHLNTVGTTGQLLRGLIFSKERRYPIVVFNGDSEAHKKEATKLATQLAGKAQVIVIASNPELGQEIKESIEPEMNIGYLRMRVFFPTFYERPRPERHRYFNILEPAYHEQREGIINGLLRNHNLGEDGQIETLSDLRRERSRAALKRLKNFQGEQGSNEELEFLRELTKEQDTLIAEQEQKVSEAEADATDFAKAHDELEAEVGKLKWQIERTGHAKSEAPTFDSTSELITLPQNLEEVVHLSAKLWSEQLSFAENAYRSASESANCALWTDGWAILSHIATTLYDLKFQDGSSGDIAKRFQEVSGYEYCKTEGKATKDNKSLASTRTIEHEGKKFEIWAHIKKGNVSPKMIRIHFAFDEEKKRIVIGYVGEHMPNSTSRKVG